MSTTGHKTRPRFQSKTGVIVVCLSALGLYFGVAPSREPKPAVTRIVARATGGATTTPGHAPPSAAANDEDRPPVSTEVSSSPSAAEPDDDSPATDDSARQPPAVDPPLRVAAVSAVAKPKHAAPTVRIGKDQLSGTIVYIPFVPSAAPRPRVLKENGLVFSGQSDQIGLVKAQMDQLLKQMGWTANQVLVRESVGGERISYTLNSAPGDTNTFVLSQRPQLGIGPEIISYVNRQGEKKTLALVSQKEILATMLQAGRAFLFSGPNCRVELLKEQIALRQNVVYWGMRADWVFPEDKLYRYNTADYWQVMKGDEWTLKPGVKASEAIADAFVGKFSYQIGCTSACRFIFTHGIFDFYQAVQANPSVTARLGQLLDSQRPFIDIAPKVDRNRIVVKGGRLMERHTDVPCDNWVPGDWGWIRNDDNKSAEELGSEGCNIIYAGGGYFVNYYPERPPKTLDQAIKRVYGWRFGLEESELELPADLMDQLRRDPRADGMLRDVRDFPRTMSAAPPAQPGA